MQTQIEFLNILEEVKLLYKPTVPTSKRYQITSAKEVYDLIRSSWEGLSHYESFKVLFLNRANRVLGIKTISQGGLSATVADPRLIFQAALLMNASAIILLHNHPSGNLNPSEADRILTKKHGEAGKFLEIPVLDHIILTEEGYYSFAEEGNL